jgi:hypothetical protein
MSKSIRSAFWSWLRRQGYERVADSYPGAVHASSLVDDFIEATDRDAVLRPRLEAAANQIGYVSDYDAVMGDDDLLTDD